MLNELFVEQLPRVLLLAFGLEIFEGVGHYPHCEAPERFVAVLTEFIESTVPAQIAISPLHALSSAAS